MPDPHGHFHVQGKSGPITGKVVTFVGNGACNVGIMDFRRRETRL